jgi:N-acetylmuramoyl-L-alanine amidase
MPQQTVTPAGQSSSPVAPPAQPPPAAPQPGLPQAIPPTPQAPVHAGPVIVLDPAHGGTDNGARGQSGAVEKDIVLIFARNARLELERQGFRVVMTRNDDSNPSYDDRAAIANAYRDAIFISFHVSSTGTIGTARTYSYSFVTPIPPTSPVTDAAGARLGIVTPSRSSSSGLLPWEEAQRPYTDASHHLADLLQTLLAQRFSGSPSVSSGVAVRELRSVEAPAIAIELSSMSVSDPNTLIGMAAQLSNAIGRTIQAYRPTGILNNTPEEK